MLTQNFVDTQKTKNKKCDPSMESPTTEIHVHIFIDLFDSESPTTDHQLLNFGFWHSVVGSR